MPDEYVARYQGLSHEELWKQLKAGDPNQVDTLAAAWKSLHDTAGGLATALNQDLAKLTAEWSSTSGTEYQRRLGLISSYTDTMAGEFSSLYGGLTLMSGSLRKAQKEAEDPAATDDHDQLLKDAAVGFAVAGPVGGVVCGIFGHSQDEEEKAKAHQQMIQLVAGLAADYGVTRQSTWTDKAPMPPIDLPGPDSGGRYQAAAGPSVNSPGTVGGTHAAFATQRTVSDPRRPSPGPEIGSGTGHGVPGADTSTTLAGAGSLTGADMPGFGVPAATTLAGAGSMAAAAAVGGPGSGYPLGGAAGARGLDVNSPAGGASQTGTADPRSAAGSRLVARQGAAGGGRGNGEDDEPDERMTWLTEDDMVWGTDEQYAPSTLGERPSEGPDDRGSEDPVG